MADKTGPQFCHLHNHTQYSMLDGASLIDDLVKHARQMNQPALAITDHGNMFGAIEFYKACQASFKDSEKDGLPPLKPIIGMEVYVVPKGESRTKREKIEGEPDCHLVLWATETDGYKNLMKLSLRSFKEGFYYHPRLDLESLAQHSKGLLASSGCIKGEVPQAIIKKDYAAGCAQAAVYQEIFGKKNFYFELQDHCTAAQTSTPEALKLASQQKKVNEAFTRMARQLGGKIICTNDSHYTTRDDAQAHDVLLCVGTGKRLDDAERLRFPTDQFYLKSSDEMATLFSSEALQNTLDVAERCNLKLELGTYHFPVFRVPDGADPNVFFRRLVEEGLRQRYGNPHPSHVLARAEKELRVLEKMGFIGYLLIVWDIVREAHRRGIPVGPGRGSAAGSVVCYALGITNLCPLRHNLLFERFVNESRQEMPDIDIDFCQSRRPEIIEYVKDKYGYDRTANIVTFNCMQAKGAVRDVGRALGWSREDVGAITKLIPNSRGVVLQAAPANRADATHYAVEDDPALAELYQKKPRVRELIDIARKFEGIARNTGCHPAGLVIAGKPLTDYCPLFVDRNGLTITQYEMGHLDSVGLLKIDMLGLETLTKVRLACLYIRERHGITVDLDRLPLDDKQTYQMLSRGDSLGVFQFESDGLRRLLPDVRPSCFEDLIALNAMYRPGPAGQIPSFCARKQGKERIGYLVPQLEPILKGTYGIIVYQEQVMQIAHELASFTLPEADNLRKAMAKKKKDLMKQYEEQFLQGCAKNGIARAKELYDLIAKFAEYGFNRSHAAAYAFLAFQTAWLKTHYQTEYFAAILSIDQSEKRQAYEKEVYKFGIDMVPPEINTSTEYVTVADEKTLRSPLTVVDGVSEKAAKQIMAIRKECPFTDLFDFCERVAMPKGAVEALIKAGAFNSLCGAGNQEKLLAVLDAAITGGVAARRSQALGQGFLF